VLDLHREVITKNPKVRATRPPTISKGLSTPTLRKRRRLQLLRVPKTLGGVQLCSRPLTRPDPSNEGLLSNSSKIAPLRVDTPTAVVNVEVVAVVAVVTEVVAAVVVAFRAHLVLGQTLPQSRFGPTITDLILVER
jgi:hypothetical protein